MLHTVRHSFVLSVALVCAVAATMAAPGVARAADIKTAQVLQLSGVDKIVAAAEKAARAKKARVVIAVVDASGALVVLRRLDDTQVASVGVAIDKARTAAIYRRPSRDFEEQTKRGRVAALALHGAVPLQGGIPIIVGSEVVGAIGVSGETPKIDEDIAIAGAAAARTLRR